MKPQLILPLLAAAIWNHSLLADDLEDFDKQTSHFYLAPSEESFNSFQKNADRLREKLREGGNGADLIVAVMIARISQANDWPIIEGAFKKPAEEILAGKSRMAKFVNDDSQLTPQKLDIWWGSFSATGDETYLEKLFKYAGEELSRDDVGRLLVVGAAKWSFKSNCRQHKKVLEFARQKLKSTSLSETQSQFLKECIEYAESKDAEPATPEAPADASKQTNS